MTIDDNQLKIVWCKVQLGALSFLIGQFSRTRDLFGLEFWKENISMTFLWLLKKLKTIKRHVKYH